MKCVYCDKVKAYPQVFTDTDPDTAAQVTYAVCPDCMIDNWEVDRNTL